MAVASKIEVAVVRKADNGRFVRGAGEIEPQGVVFGEAYSAPLAINRRRRNGAKPASCERSLS